jgi:hypothetical protein
MSDNNTDPDKICRWLRWHEKRGKKKGEKNWVNLFFHNNLNSGAYIVSKELNQDTEMFK